MTIDLVSVVLEKTSELRRAISAKTSEIAQLENELKRHEAVLQLLGHNGKETKDDKQRYVDFSKILSGLPESFRLRDFYKAAAKTKKSPLYLRQTLWRWTKEGKLKRVHHGEYRKVEKRKRD